MPEDVLLVEKKDYICTFTINRPERRNALTPALMFELGDTINSIRDDDEVRVVVIRGNGELSFSSGMDLGGDRGSWDAVRARQVHPIQHITDCVVGYPGPVIAMIYGYAVGAGLDLAVSCDLRLAADDARMGMPPVRIGGIYNASAIQRFINLVGPAQTKELFFTAKLIEAQRAAQIGLVDHIVPAGELCSTTYGLAGTIAANAPLAVRGTKTVVAKLLACQRLSPEDEGEIQALMELAERSEDRREGQRAFLEKRQPRFTGR